MSASYVVIGVNEKLLTRHISGPITKYICFKSATRVGQELWLVLGLRDRVGLGLGIRLGVARPG